MNDYLNWRYATKKFDPTKKVSKEDLAELLEALRLAPSSYGLQPWRFVVVQDENLRKEIRKHAWNQPQITEASSLIVLCSLKIMDESHIKNYVVKMAQVQKVSVESLAGYEQLMTGAFKGKSADDVSHWMKRQVYLALGMFLSACAQKKIDACPMEGFDPKRVDEVLGLDKLGLESVVLCPVGYRANDDRHANLNKVRFDKNEVIIEK
jgi:nitroreductase